MSYTHLIEQERICIFHQKMAGFSNAEMGRRLKRHRGTVGRELNRFHRHPSWPYYRQYFPDGADQMARQRRRQARGARWTGHRPLLAYVLKKLRKEWSPQQIAGRIKMEFPDDDRMRVSHPSIYAYIRSDRKAGGSLWKRLRQSHKLRRKPYGSGPRRCRIPDRVGIEQRPPQAESRKHAGHWEADTMLAKKGRLATCVERKSRYVLIARLPNGKALEFNKAAIRCFRKIPRRWRKTITTDNGSEFIEHKELGSRLGFKTFFANPYSSWERGTNENTNGLIRQYLPKNIDLSEVSYQRVARIADKLNNRPRKCLAYRTPAEVLGPVLRL
jgi:transposase, IS30 family